MLAQSVMMASPPPGIQRRWLTKGDQLQQVSAFFKGGDSHEWDETEDAAWAAITKCLMVAAGNAATIRAALVEIDDDAVVKGGLWRSECRFSTAWQSQNGLLSYTRHRVQGLDASGGEWCDGSDLKIMG